MSDSTPVQSPRFTAQIKLEGAAAEFVLRAVEAAEKNNVGFLLQAVQNESVDLLNEPFPELPVRTRRVPPVQKGSKIPEARELFLSTKEYKRRVKLLTEAGVAITKESVAKVPAKVPAKAPRKSNSTATAAE